MSVSIRLNFHDFVMRCFCCVREKNVVSTPRKVTPESVSDGSPKPKVDGSSSSLSALSKELI